MIRPRYLEQEILADLKEKMIFIAGPRQVGKTTLARSIARGHSPYSYFNWDDSNDRKTILAGKFDPKSNLLIFDEIHKYPKWKNLIKGIFDKHKDRFSIIVTGSARLDLYRKGGDSLQGRYYHYRLHPFSLAELLKEKPKIIPFQELHFSSTAQKKLNQAFDLLWKFGGFPEPLFKKEERELRRFHSARLDRLIKEDIRDATILRDIASIQLLADLLPSKVASLFSINSLKEDLQVTHKTLSLWVDALERFYYHFRIYPFYSHSMKSLRKEPKLYLWDWSELTSESAKLENMVASHLLKFVHFLIDREGYKAELFFLRDIEGREVDFLVTIDKKPWFAVEVKMTESERTKTLRFFQNKLKIPFVYQVINEQGIDFLQNDIRVMSAPFFLSGLV